MKVSELTEKDITDALTDQLLFEGLEPYRGQIADAAIVLGSSKAHLYRLPPVMEAYKKGTVKKIVVSGYTRNIEGQHINEGQLLRDKALEQGASGDDIIVEDRASNTWENLAFSRELLREKGLLAEGMRIAVATSSYHMRRSLGIARKVFAHDRAAIVPIPGEDRSTGRDTWYTSEKGRQRCRGEVLKIIWSVRQGLMDDWEL